MHIDIRCPISICYQCLWPWKVPVIYVPIDLGFKNIEYKYGIYLNNDNIKSVKILHIQGY